MFTARLYLVTQYVGLIENGMGRPLLVVDHDLQHNALLLLNLLGRTHRLVSRCLLTSTVMIRGLQIRRQLSCCTGKKFCDKLDGRNLVKPAEASYPDMES